MWVYFMTVPAQPVALPANQFDHFYRGGDRIGALRGGPGGPQRPEEWIGSATSRFGTVSQGLTVLPDGQVLAEAVAADPVAWFGTDHADRYGSSTELLVKLLDLGQRLPVHLHPNREFARTHLGLSHGKTEAWIVLDAPAGAQVGVGFKEQMSLDQVSSWVMNRNSEALLSALQTKTVQPGDCMLVPAGLPHTVQEGVFVLELQEPSDMSILLEWQDFAVDGFVDGHLGLGFDTALQAVDLTAISASDLDALVIPAASVAGSGVMSLMPSAADQYFRADRVDARGGDVGMPAGFAVLLILEGSGVLHSGVGDQPVSTGDAILIAHAHGDWTLSGDVMGVACRPPAADAAPGAR
jgi:mannose-6-phosphate isomerase